METGDEVIVPAFTFWATAQAVLCQNAIPVFVDIDPAAYNIDPGRIEEKITSRTKALIVVHVHGLPCDMDEINAIAQKHGIAVLEDAAHAHGSEYRGRKTGNLGDMAMFSLRVSVSRQRISLTRIISLPSIQSACSPSFLPGWLHFIIISKQYHRPRSIKKGSSGKKKFPQYLPSEDCNMSGQ